MEKAMTPATEIKHRRSYERQEKLGLKLPEGVIIVGCGGTGTWTALALLLAGVRRFVLIDEDALATHNLNRLPYPPDQVGVQKTRCLMDLMDSIEPEADIEELWRMAEPEKADDTEASFEDYFNSNEEYVIVDCTDDLKIQQYLSKLCKTHKREYFRVGCSDDLVFVGKSVPSGAFAEDMKQGYGTPSWVAPPMIAGALAVQAICGGKEIKIVGVKGGN